jgi:hypothetical protein
MKKTILLAFALVAGGLGIDYHSNHALTNSSGAPQGKTGAPGEGTCNDCHSGPAVSNQVLTVTSTVPDQGYVPGSSYTITVQLTGGLSNTFGFQASPQNTSGVLQGTMTAGTGTQLIGGNKWITHTAAGNQGSGNAKTWTFQWTAPNPGTGNLTFYVAGNFASGSNGNQSDVIRTTTLALSQASGVGIQDISERGYAVFPNPATDHVTIALPNDVVNATASLFDISGRITLSERLTVTGGISRLDLNKVRPGMYMLALEYNGTRKVTKVLVD